MINPIAWFDGARPGESALVLGTNLDLLAERVEREMRQAEAVREWEESAGAWKRRRAREVRREVKCFRPPPRRRRKVRARPRTDCGVSRPRKPVQDILAGFSEGTLWSWRLHSLRWCGKQGLEATEANVRARMVEYAQRRLA